LSFGNYALAVRYGGDALGLDGWQPEGWTPSVQLQHHFLVCLVSPTLEVSKRKIEDQQSSKFNVRAKEKTLSS
jgi:hypothetical protein